MYFEVKQKWVSLQQRRRVAFIFWTLEIRFGDLYKMFKLSETNVGGHCWSFSMIFESLCLAFVNTAFVIYVQTKGRYVVFQIEENKLVWAISSKLKSES